MQSSWFNKDYYKKGFSPQLFKWGTSPGFLYIMYTRTQIWHLKHHYKVGYILNPSIDMPFTRNKALIDFALVPVI